MTQKCPSCDKTLQTPVCETCGTTLSEPVAVRKPPSFARQMMPPLLVAAGGLGAYVSHRSTVLLVGVVAAVLVSLLNHRRAS